MKNNLATQTENLLEEVDKFQLKWDQMKPKEDILLDERHGNDDSFLLSSVKLIEEKRKEWTNLVEDINKNK